MIAVKATAAGAGSAVAVQAGTVLMGAQTDVLMTACVGAVIGLAFTKPDLWSAFLPSEATPLWLRFGKFLSRATTLSLLVAGAALVSAWLAEHVVPLAATEYGFAWVAQIPAHISAGLMAVAGPTVTPFAWGVLKGWLKAKVPA